MPAPQYCCDAVPVVIAVTCRAPFVIVAIGLPPMAGVAYVNVPPIGSVVEPSAPVKSVMIGLWGAKAVNAQPSGRGEPLPPAPVMLWPPVGEPAIPVTNVPPNPDVPPRPPPPIPPRPVTFPDVTPAPAQRGMMPLTAHTARP